MEIVVESVDEIMKEAKTFYKSVAKNGKQPTWHDYEYFKKKLHDNGIFGYEYQIADILNI